MLTEHYFNYIESLNLFFYRQQRLNDVEAKKIQKDVAFNEKEAKKVSKEEAESPEREALDKIRVEEERLEQIKKEEQRLENERKAVDYFNKLDSDQNVDGTKEEMIKEIRFDQNNDGIISDDEAAFYLSGHDSYNKVLEHFGLLQYER